MKKIAFITGGSRGIGKTVAITLAKAGYDIALTYNINEDKAKDVQGEIIALGSRCIILQCDISNESLVKEVVYKVIKEYGKIDLLINNASIAIDTLFADKTAENFRRTLDVNLVGTFIVSKTVGEYMMHEKSGKIIIISSTNGINTYYPMCLDYDASKAGVISLTHNLAMQFAPYINVNAIAPGFIGTESEVKDMDEEFIEMEKNKIFLRRIGSEQDVANLVEFLASDKADFINSEVIRIDGGQYGA